MTEFETADFMFNKTVNLVNISNIQGYAMPNKKQAFSRMLSGF